MLNEGKGELKEGIASVKEGVETTKQIYGEVTGFWSWVKGLFGVEDKPKRQVDDISVVDTPKSSSAAPVKQTKQREPIGEDDVIEAFLTHFTNFVEAQTTILDTIEDERDKILNVWNPKQNNRRAAIDLIRYERRINDMAMEMSELMAGAPRRLGSVREQFSEKLDEVRDAQSAARERFRIRKHQEAWQRDLLRNHRIDRAVATATVLLVLLWIWGTLLSVGWLARTHAGS